MKSEIILGIIGCLLLLIAGFLPLAFINSDPITIFPIFQNLELRDGIWEWNDISAFALTYPVVTILSLYFIIKKKAFGIKICGSIIFIITFFMLVGVWISQTKAGSLGNINFSYSYAWLIIIAGSILLIYSGKILKHATTDNF